jgi:hypothetical protein
MNAETAVLDYLDGMQQGVSLSVIIKQLPDYPVDDLKAATRKLYEEIRINRLSVMGDHGKFYYIFYSLYVRTVTVHREVYERHETPAPAPIPEEAPPVAPEPPPEAPVAPAVPEGPLTADEAVAVLEKGGWEAQPEEVMVERRVADRRVLTAMDVIDRWKLPYRLSRIIEVIATARKKKLDGNDAALVSALIRDHVQKEAA